MVTTHNGSRKRGKCLGRENSVRDSSILSRAGAGRVKRGAEQTLANECPGVLLCFPGLLWEGLGSD